MTLNQLIKKITEEEGKKKSVSIGNIREVISILRRMIKEDPSILTILVKK